MMSRSFSLSKQSYFKVQTPPSSSQSPNGNTHRHEFKVFQLARQVPLTVGRLALVCELPLRVDTLQLNKGKKYRSDNNKMFS